MIANPAGRLAGVGYFFCQRLQCRFTPSPLRQLVILGVSQVFSAFRLMRLSNCLIFLQFLYFFILLKLLNPFLHLGLQQGFVGQIELVSRCIDICLS